MTSSLLITSLISLLGFTVALEMVADINMAGIKGKVTLSRNVTDPTEPAVVKDPSLAQYDSIDLYSAPAVFGREMKATEVCKSGIGTQVTSLVNQVSTMTASESDYFHRTIKLTSTINSSLPQVCATVLPSSVTSYRAKFIGPIVGTLWIRYTAGMGAFTFGQLSFSNGGSEQTASLTMYQEQVDNSGAFTARCSSLSGSNSIDLNSTAKVTGSVTSSKIFTSFDASLVPSGYKSIGVKIGNTVEACATLRVVPAKTITVPVNWDGVKGKFTFTQNSPLDKTSATIKLEGLGNRASGYHVHKYPVPQRMTSSENPCDPQFVSGHFNPYNVVVASSPAAGTGTNDQYEIGDLSGKYGNLASQTMFDQTFDDWNLPLWGPNNIAGRSIVIHKTDGSRMLCSTVGFPASVTSAITTFKSPAYGTMYFRQDATNPDEDASVFLELANSDKTASNEHNWHVHVSPVGDDAYTTDGRCSSAGPHYNPSGISVADPYKSECRVQDPLRCELGDLSGRLGKINIASTWRTEGGKYFFTDEYLHLSGPFSVLGRSVVVHVASAGAGRYACANITQLHPVIAKTGTWTGASEGTITGTLTLEQTSEFDTTKASGSFSGLDSQASGYHIHEFTIPSSAPAGSECGNDYVAGHYNPFNWTGSKAATVGTYDQYEVGDLSNKYGLLDSVASHTLQSDIADTNLPLFTPLASGEKSIVIHKKTGGTRWKCSNLMTEPPAQSNGYIISATVTYSSVVNGTIKLRQIVYEDAGSALTSYDVNVSPASGSEVSPQHNWHIHVDPVTSEDGCDIAKGHYDPYSAISGPNYSSDCKPTNPLYCEVGDISNKQAKYDIGGGRKAFHDVDTPMHTNYSVLGRSIVFHVANAGAPRYACANIIPDSFAYTLSFPSSTTFQRYSFTKTVADALGISRLRVIIVHNTDVPIVRGGCSKVMVHIAGGDSITTSKLDDLVSGTLAGLSPYAPTSSCTSSKGVESLGETSSTSTCISSSFTIMFAIVASCIANKFV